MNHLKVFGSIAYARIPAETRRKLNDCAKKTIFVGYAHGGYKLFNPITKKVILSKDVTFAEMKPGIGMLMNNNMTHESTLLLKKSRKKSLQ